MDIETAIVTFESSAEIANTVKTSLAKMGYPALDEENSTVAKAKSFVSCAIGKIS